MNDMNDQMMNFRKSLGLDEPVDSKVVKEKSTKSEKSDGERMTLAGGRTTITIPAELLGKMKLLSFWMTREGLRRNMSMSQMVWEMFECYLDKYEGARGFVAKNLD